MRILAEALTFDDVSLVPAHSIVLPREANLAIGDENGIHAVELWRLGQLT